MEESKDLDPAVIKNKVIEMFKQEKMNVTTILQNELKDQISQLNKEMEDFKAKDSLSKTDLDEHNRKINDIQRKINIIYQRSHRHITKIMEELNMVMEQLGDELNSM